MNNSEMDIAQQLLDRSLQSESKSPNNQQNIIPPVGIANPELLQSFIGNFGDEEKILRDIRDVEAYQRENLFESAEREAKSYGLRALEGLGGGIGGLLNALSGEANFNDRGELQENVPTLPSSHKLREFTKEKTGKKYEPKTEFAKHGHEVTSDIGAGLAFPGTWIMKLLTPILGQSVKAIGMNQGLSEKNADLAKNIFMVTSTIAGNGNAPRIARNAYHEAVNMMPENARMSARYLQQEINALKNTPSFRTGRSTAIGPAMDELKRIENSIQQGSMNVRDAMAIRKKINEARNQLGSFLYQPGIDKKAAREYLDQVDNVLRTNMERYGQANNPNWLKNYQRANQAYAVTRKSQQLQDYISSHPLGKHLQSDTAKTLFHYGAISGLSHTSPLIAGAIGPLAAGGKTIQVINRMIRSPVLRNHYLEVLTAAAAQNAGAMHRALTRFDNEAEKLEKKNQKFSASSSPNK